MRSVFDFLLKIGKFEQKTPFLYVLGFSSFLLTATLTPRGTEGNVNSIRSWHVWIFYQTLLCINLKTFIIKGTFGCINLKTFIIKGTFGCINLKTFIIKGTFGCINSGGKIVTIY